MSQATVVVWDMGGVINRYFTQVIFEIGQTKGWPVERIPMGPSGVVHDADYAAMCEGEIDEPEYLQRFVTALQSEGIDFDPRTDVAWDDHWRPETFDLIRRLHTAGIQQVILTNDATKWKGEGWWDAWEYAHLFDAIVDVATLPNRKPHPAPYLAAAAAVGAPVHRCIFVDDMPVNCRGADAVGMQSLWFDVTHPERSLADLSERIST